MLVHHVDHAVAESPEEEERTDEREGDEVAFAVSGGEETLFVHEETLEKIMLFRQGSRFQSLELTTEPGLIGVA
jgi:hypothetical protein